MKSLLDTRSVTFTSIPTGIREPVLGQHNVIELEEPRTDMQEVEH